MAMLPGFLYRVYRPSMDSPYVEPGCLGIMDRTVHRLAITALALTLLMPAASAANYKFGTPVEAVDFDFSLSASAAATSALCFVDTDGNGRVNLGERIVLARGRAVCDTLMGKDIRLTASGAFAAGTEAKATDSDATALTPVPANAARYFDADGDAKFRKADTMYLDLTSIPSSQVSVGDVRLSPFGSLPAGSFVMSGDGDLNMPLTDLPGGPVDLAATANTILSSGKGVYLNANSRGSAPSVIREGDLRLNGAVANPFDNPGPQTGQPKLEVTRINASPTISAGQAYQVFVAVKNADKVTGSGLLETRIDGLLVDARGTPTLAPGESATLAITLVAPVTPGYLELDVGGVKETLPIEGVAPNAPPISPAAAQIQRQNVPSPAGAIVVLAFLGLALVVRARAS